MQIHVVQSGDSVWRISQRYGSDINQIIAVNELDRPDRLVIGQSLVVPEQNKEYVVQPGDNLWAISAHYRVPFQLLANYNQIANPALIYSGQMLQFPYFQHVMQQGEDIWQIAGRYQLPVEQLLQFNGLSNPWSLSPGQAIWIPAVNKPMIEVNGYITEMGERGRHEIMSKGPLLTYVTPSSYNVREDGSIRPLRDSFILEAAALTFTSPLLAITNINGGTFSSDIAAAILRNENLQENLLTQVLSEIRTKGYTGLHVNFEYVFPEDKENLNQFLRRAQALLHPEGYSLSSALVAKVSSDQQGLLYEAHDYRAHGEICDFVVLMTYEWGWAGGPPWAIAPIGEVRKVLDYAVTEIPRNKILMGMPLYGRDWKIPWVEGTRAQTVMPKAAVQLAAQYGASIQYDVQDQAPFFHYRDETGQEHEVWFEDARSVQAKYDTVKQYGLRGVAYWTLGMPFPQNWPVLQDNFSTIKRTVMNGMDPFP